MKKSIIAGLLGLSLFTASCLGPNNAFNRVHAWNEGMSESKWVNELAFLGLNIIPVYGFALFGDYLIFNSMEFWGMDNPIEAPK